MKPILAIDPGNIQSAFCLIDPDGYKPLDFAKQENEQIRKVVNRYCTSKGCGHVVIEMIGHYGAGMPAGQTLFDTIQYLQKGACKSASMRDTKS